MATSALSSVTATASPRVVIVTELCKQKAGYVAHLSYGAADDTGFLAELFTGLLCIFIFVGTIALYMDDARPGPPNPKHVKIFFYVATVCLLLMAFCFTTLVLTILHQYFCIENADLKEYRDSCVLVGSAIIPWIVMALLNWLFLAFNLVIGRVLGRQLETPWGLFIIAPLVLLILVIIAAIRDLINGLKYAISACCGQKQTKYSSEVHKLFLRLKQKMKEGVMWLRGYELLELGGWKAWRIQDAEEDEAMDLLAVDAPRRTPDAPDIAANHSLSEDGGAGISGCSSNKRRDDSFEV